MAAKKAGELIKEARTAAGLTQEKLAKAAKEGLTANDISRCERGEIDLTTNQLRKIAIACGVTQTSLVNAPKNVSGSAARKTAAKKTDTTKKPAAKTASAAKKKPAAQDASSKKTASAKTPAVPANANTSMKVTAAEKKLIEAYRSASSDLKKTALKVLKGEFSDTAMNMLNLVGGGSAGAADSIGGNLGTSLGDTVTNLLGGLLGGKK